MHIVTLLVQVVLHGRGLEALQEAYLTSKEQRMMALH